MQQNALWSSMPRESQSRLHAQAQRISAAGRTVLCEFGEPSEYVFFPLNGMTSLLSITEEGDSVEVATVGREGLIGLIGLGASQQPAYQVNVQLPTELLRVTVSAFRQEIARTPALQGVLMFYTQRLFAQTAQNAVCYRFHSMRQRLCRWLLTARDRSDGDTLAITQEIMAQTLGLPRTGVTSVAVALQDAGAIRCRHGRITVMNRAPLLACSCECYAILRNDLQSQLTASR